MSLSDILGWASLVLIGVPLLVFCGFALSAILAGAPLVVAACAWSIAAGGVLFALAVALD